MSSTGQASSSLLEINAGVSHSCRPHNGCVLPTAAGCMHAPASLWQNAFINARGMTNLRTLLPQTSQLMAANSHSRGAQRAAAADAFKSDDAALAAQVRSSPAAPGYNLVDLIADSPRCLAFIVLAVCS